jgi:Predicted unsaturated glucuronyl hydrolase involved in regulation of bacterial surface properties, and related proteins
MQINKTILEDKLNLVVNKLKNLQRPDNETTISSSMADGGQSVGLFPRDFGMDPWDWPQGVGLYGMYNLYDVNKDSSNIEFIKNWYQKRFEEGLPVRNINTTIPLLTLTYMMDELGENYMDLCKDWADWLLNSLPKTRENGFQHTTTNDASKGTINLNEGQLWVDTLFMTVLFLARMGKCTGDKKYINEAVHQYLIHIKYLYEKKAGMFYHGWSFIENSNFGGIFWCRGNSWYTASVMDLIEILGDDLDAGVKEFLIDTFKAQVDAFIDLQAESGLWNTVLDDKDSYEEVSGSAAIAYGILKGVRLGVLDKKYEEKALKTINAIILNVDENGTVLNVSAGTGMGMNKEHYKNIIIAPMAYGQSLSIMALAEALRHI